MRCKVEQIWQILTLQHLCYIFYTCVNVTFRPVFYTYVITPLAVERGGVINSPRSNFLFSFFFGVESWAAAHGRYRWHQVA